MTTAAAKKIVQKPSNIAFAKNLRTAMNLKGFTQSALVDRAQAYAPKSHPISRSNISEYCNGKKLPGPVRLNAICKALGVQVTDLMPLTTPRTRSPLPIIEDRPVPLIEVADIGDGKARLKLDRILTWEAVTEVMKIINRNPVSEGKSERPNR